MDVLASNLPLVVSILWLLYHSVMFTTPLVFGSLSLTSAHVNTATTAAPTAASQGADTDAQMYAHAGGHVAMVGGAADAGGPWMGIPAGIRSVLFSQLWLSGLWCISVCTHGKHNAGMILLRVCTVISSWQGFDSCWSMI